MSSPARLIYNCLSLAVYLLLKESTTNFRIASIYDECLNFFFLASVNTTGKTSFSLKVSKAFSSYLSRSQSLFPFVFNEPLERRVVETYHTLKIVRIARCRCCELQIACSIIATMGDLQFSEINNMKPINSSTRDESYIFYFQPNAKFFRNSHNQFSVIFLFFVLLKNTITISKYTSVICHLILYNIATMTSWNSAETIPKTTDTVVN